MTHGDKPTEQIELLIRIDERTKEIKSQLDDHLAWHRRARLVLYGTLSTAIMALVAALFRK